MGDFIKFLVGCVLLCACFAGIFKQAGYARAYALLMLVPLVNIVALVVVAVREWPVTRELARLRLSAGEAIEGDAVSVLNQAIGLENRGQSQAAASLFQLILDKVQDESIRQDATTCLARLKGQKP